MTALDGEAADAPDGARHVAGIPVFTGETHRWAFRPVEGLMTEAGEGRAGFKAFLRHLQVGDSGFFKVHRHWPALPRVLHFVAPVALAAWAAAHWDAPPYALAAPPASLGRVATVALVTLTLLSLRARLWRPAASSQASRSLAQAGAGVALVLIGGVSAWLFKRLDTVYLWLGRVEWFVDADPPPPGETPP